MKIFLSYAEADHLFARYITDVLQTRGAAIQTETLDDCQHVLLIYSPEAAVDPQIKIEIIAALMQSKQITVLTVRPSPATLTDFPFMFDAAVTRFTLTSPEQAAETLNSMAAHFGLSQGAVTPPDTSVFDPPAVVSPSAEGEAQTPVASSRVRRTQFPQTSDTLATMLFHISELGETRPSAALTLLLWLPRFSAEHASVLRGFRDQQMSTLRTRWMQQIEKEADSAIKAEDQTQMERLAAVARIVDPLHPLAWRLQNTLRTNRIEALWREIQAKAEADGWASTSELLEMMRSVSPLDSRTLQAVERYSSEVDYGPLYEVAAQAVDSGYNRAFAYLMGYLQQRYPHFRDTRNLLSSLKISSELVAHLKPKHILREGGSVQVMAFSPDNTLLVSGGNDGTLRLWDIEQARQVARQRRDDGGILSVAYSYDGMLLVSSTETGVVRLWQMPEGREIMTLDQFSQPVTSVCFTPDHQALICGGNGGRIQVVRIEDGIVLADVIGHQYAVTSVRLSDPIGDDHHRLLLTSSEDRTVKIWKFEITPPYTPIITELHTLKQHKMIVQEAAFSQTDPLRVASVGNDGYLCVWSAQEGELLMSQRSDAIQTRAVDFAPGLSLLASGGTDGRITLWDADSRRQLHVLHHHEGAVNAVAFSSDGLWLASGSADHSIVLWHL